MGSVAEDNQWNVGERVIAHAAVDCASTALIGGLTSRLDGGDFIDGFSVSAVGYLYNDIGHMLVGTDAHQTLLNWLRAQLNGDLWSLSNTAFGGMFGGGRPDLIYGDEDTAPLPGWEIKPYGQDAAAQLLTYTSAPGSQLVPGDNALIFQGAVSLGLESTGFLGLEKVEYTYYPSSYRGVVTYSVDTQWVFSYVASSYRAGKRAPLAQPAPCSCSN